VPNSIIVVLQHLVLQQLQHQVQIQFYNLQEVGVTQHNGTFRKNRIKQKVIEVQSVVNEVLHDSNGVEQEVIGIDFLTKLTGWSIWKQTSYNTRGGVHLTGGTPFRKNFAGKGYKYDEDRDAFIPPKPFNSWVLNEDTCLMGSTC
jgi:hypothetical protein